MEYKKKMFGVDSFTLKLIAIFSMAADHIGAILYPSYLPLRVVGRLAFPIFAYLLVEGYVHTHDIRKYMLRMGAFALLSEIPFDMAFMGKMVALGHQNVFFTLFLGLALLYFYDRAGSRAERFLIVLSLLLLAEFVRCDYSSMGLLMIFCFYLFRKNLAANVFSMCVINAVLMGGIQSYGALAAIPIALHNGEQGPKLKYLFYVFYPAHLLILYGIKMWVFGAA